MSHRERRFSVEALARVEGEGALHVVIDDGAIIRTELRIYEPPRFFEAFLRGRAYTEPPDLTARICGICPVAYQTSACNAIEDACAATIPEPIQRLRRLLYYGEWIESHTLHVYLLHAPDFLGIDGATELAATQRDVLERGLELKKSGNELVELIGGRAIHPVNVRLGGFYRAPSVAEIRAFRPRLERAKEHAEATIAWVAGFEFPDLTIDHPFAALSTPERYGIDNGRLHTTTGLELDPHEFDDHFHELQVPHSTALHCSLDDEAPYLVGPLARYALNNEQLAPDARSAANAAGLGTVERNPFRSIVVRAVEVLHAVCEALAEIDAYTEPATPAVDVAPRAGVGCGWSEAPRGMLWHRYELAADGEIATARIVPPTSQNQAAIEEDVRRFIEEHLDADDDALQHGAEQAIRNHDPCISCATHFLDFTAVRR